MMKPSGNEFSRDKIAPHSDLRAGTASDRIIKKEVMHKHCFQIAQLYPTYNVSHVYIVIGKNVLSWKEVQYCS